MAGGAVGRVSQRAMMSVPHLFVNPLVTKMRLVLPEDFHQGNEQRRLWWMRDVCGKGSHVPVEDGVFRPARTQFWQVTDGMVDTFGVARCTVAIPPRHKLPLALKRVGWQIESNAVDDAGVATRTWVMTRGTIRRTPLRSPYMWRISA